MVKGGPHSTKESFFAFVACELNVRNFVKGEENEK